MAGEALNDKSRCASYEWIVQDKSVPKTIREWASRMEDKYETPACRINQDVYPWLAALYIVRYGKNENRWPRSFTSEDLTAAESWEDGTIPNNVSHS